MMSIWWVYSLDPMGVVLWCMHNIQIARLSVLGSFLNYGGIIGSSYIMVSTLKCVMTCESGKRPSWGLRLWHQFGSIVISIVAVSRLFLAASFAQWRVCRASFFVCGWAYPFPFHLCWNAIPIDPHTLFWGNGEENCWNVVGHVTGDEKYECVMWNELMRCSRMVLRSVYCESLRGTLLGVLYLYLV